MSRNLNKLEAELDPETYAALERAMLPRYRVADLDEGTPAQVRVALHFIEALREVCGGARVFIVPKHHISGNHSNVAIIFDGYSTCADEVQFSERWHEVEEADGAYLESINNWSTSAYDFRKRKNPRRHRRVKRNPRPPFEPPEIDALVEATNDVFNEEEARAFVDYCHNAWAAIPDDVDVYSVDCLWPRAGDNEGSLWFGGQRHRGVLKLRFEGLRSTYDRMRGFDVEVAPEFADDMLASSAWQPDVEENKERREYNERVLVEYMPRHIRDSHQTAGSLGCIRTTVRSVRVFGH